jgi:hypothetical protein
MECEIDFEDEAADKNANFGAYANITDKKREYSVYFLYSVIQKNPLKFEFEEIANVFEVKTQKEDWGNWDLFERAIKKELKRL